MNKLIFAGLFNAEPGKNFDNADPGNLKPDDLNNVQKYEEYLQISSVTLKRFEDKKKDEHSKLFIPLIILKYNCLIGQIAIFCCDIH